MSESRTGVRFPVELPIRIQVSDIEAEQAGTTSNISAAGVYIKTQASGSEETSGQAVWRPGSVVSFEMTLPAEVIGASEDAHVQCCGRVVRVEKLKDDPRNGVACVIDNYEFVRRP